MSRCLIIGQGIAGSVLAYRLIKKGVDVHIYDQGSDNSASAVSSGLINPITGRNFVKTWILEKLYPEAITLYKDIEENFKISFLNDINIFRNISDIKDENLWNSRLNQEGYEPYMSEIDRDSKYKGFLNGISKTGPVRMGLQINTSLLLSTLRNNWLEREVLTPEAFVHGELRVSHKSFRYREEEYDHVVFCEGWKAANNPFFPNIDLQLFKGELLHVRFSDLPKDSAIKSSMYIIHMFKDLYWVGSTNAWFPNQEAPTPEKFKQLLAFLNDKLKVAFEIVDHKAGIRPSTNNRKPYIRRHPTHPNMYIFNGFGTKGLSLSPYWSKVLVEGMISAKELDTEF